MWFGNATSYSPAYVQLTNPRLWRCNLQFWERSISCRVASCRHNRCRKTWSSSVQGSEQSESSQDYTASGSLFFLKSFGILNISTEGFYIETSVATFFFKFYGAKFQIYCHHIKIKRLLTFNWSGCTNRVNALNEVFVTKDVPDLRGDARHDAHAQNYVVEVCQLDADLGQRGTDGTHTVGDNVHDAAFHAAREAVVQLFVERLRADPLPEDPLHAVLHVRHRVVLLLGADERLALHPSDICWVSANQIAVKEW